MNIIKKIKDYFNQKEVVNTIPFLGKFDPTINIVCEDMKEYEKNLLKEYWLRILNEKSMLAFVDESKVLEVKYDFYILNIFIKKDNKENGYYKDKYSYMWSNINNESNIWITYYDESLNFSDIFIKILFLLLDKKIINIEKWEGCDQNLEHNLKINNLYKLLFPMYPFNQHKFLNIGNNINFFENISYPLFSFLFLYKIESFLINRQYFKEKDLIFFNYFVTTCPIKYELNLIPNSIFKKAAICSLNYNHLGFFNCEIQQDMLYYENVPYGIEYIMKNSFLEIFKKYLNIEENIKNILTNDYSVYSCRDEEQENIFYYLLINDGLFRNKIDKAVINFFYFLDKDVLDINKINSRKVETLSFLNKVIK